MSKLDNLILRTPTSPYRNKLTSIVLILQAIEDDQSDDMIKAMVNATFTPERGEASHHPGTDKVGHPVSECATRGCRSND